MGGRTYRLFDVLAVSHCDIPPLFLEHLMLVVVLAGEAILKLQTGLLPRLCRGGSVSQEVRKYHHELGL